MNPKFALIIGTTEYDDVHLEPLKTPDKDVNDLADVLQAAEIGGFEVKKLINQAWATLQEAIADFFADRKPDDLLLLYFSGHGVLDERGRLFLAAKNTRHNRLSGSAIPASFIVDEMDHCRSEHQVLVLDCCHSGAFARGVKGEAKAITQATFEGEGSGRVVLTATDALQYAWEGDQVIGQAENSVFTYYLVEGLRTGDADRNRDGWITLDELYDYVYDQVRIKTPKQTPCKWSYKQQGKLVVAKSPTPRQRANYKNFEVKDNNEFQILFKDLSHVCALTPSGFIPKGSVDMKIPEERMIQTIDDLLLNNMERVNQQDLQALGTTLYEILFGGQIGAAFRATYEKIREQPNAWLELIISFSPEAGHLANLPWESIFVPFHGGFFLSTHPRMSLTRQVQHEATKWPIRNILEPAPLPLRVLIIVSNPINIEGFDPEPIVGSLEELAYEYEFSEDLRRLYQPTRHDFYESLRTFQPHVIHFIGLVRDDRFIAFTTSEHEADWMSFDNLIDFLLSDKPQLLFLQNPLSPKSASYQKFKPYSAFRDAVLQLAYATMIPAVMTTQYPMEAPEAARFTREFYRQLLDGERLDKALKKAILDSATSDRYFPLPQICPMLYTSNGLSLGSHSKFDRRERSIKTPRAIPKGLVKTYLPCC